MAPSPSAMLMNPAAGAVGAATAGSYQTCCTFSLLFLFECDIMWKIHIKLHDAILVSSIWFF